MTRRKKIFLGILVVFGIVVFLFTNTYTSSPGFTTEEYYREFADKKPVCYGFDILLNEKATWADAPGISLCVGLLK